MTYNGTGVFLQQGLTETVLASPNKTCLTKHSRPSSSSAAHIADRQIIHRSIPLLHMHMHGVNMQVSIVWWSHNLHANILNK